MWPLGKGQWQDEGQQLQVCAAQLLRRVRTQQQVVEVTRKVQCGAAHGKHARPCKRDYPQKSQTTAAPIKGMHTREGLPGRCTADMAKPPSEWDRRCMQWQHQPQASVSVETVKIGQPRARAAGWAHPGLRQQRQGERSCSPRLSARPALHAPARPAPPAARKCRQRRLQPRHRCRLCCHISEAPRHPGCSTVLSAAAGWTGISKGASGTTDAGLWPQCSCSEPCDRLPPPVLLCRHRSGQLPVPVRLR